MVLLAAIQSNDKEMRPAHRLDILSHALLYYGIMRKQSLGTKVVSICYSIAYPDPFIAGVLAQLWKKAKGINEIATENLRCLSSLYPGCILLSLQFHVCINEGIHITIIIQYQSLKTWYSSGWTLKRQSFCFTVERSSMLNTTVYIAVCSIPLYILQLSPVPLLF